MFFRASTGLLSLGFFLAGISFAQTSRGTVTGLVRDPQKASVPNARVDLTGVGTNVTRSTQTNDSGLYRFDAVDPGVYRIEVKAPGLKGFSATNLTVGAAGVLTQDVVLEIGDVAQTVEVTEQAL